MTKPGYIVQDITTGLAWNGRPVGITRFEQEIARGLYRWDSSGRYLRFVRYDSLRSAYVWVPPEQALAWLKDDRHGTAQSRNSNLVRARLPSVSSELPSMLWRGLRKAVYRVGSIVSQPVAEYSERLLCLLLEIARELKQCYRMWKSQKEHSKEVSTHGVLSKSADLVDFSEVSCYISCGLDWDDKDTAAIYRAKQIHGFRCVFTIYDLVPSLFPEFLPRDPGRYIRYFADALWTADRILTISQSSRKDILAFAEANHLPRPEIDIVSPGSDLEPELMGVKAALSDKVCAVLNSANRFALSVGTLEARKNHRLLVDIWLDLLQEMKSEKLPHLVLVGGRGWGFEDLFRTLESWPQLKTRVHILDGLSDLELRTLYERCDIFLYPSFYEGWGIPLTEASAFGKPIISSCLSSMPEAAPAELSIFLDPLDYPAWRRAIKTWAEGSHEATTKDPDHRNIRTWKRAGEEFAAQMEKFLQLNLVQG